jgi:SGNH hydrolase-like domain, acetyltransferase AlgX
MNIGTAREVLDFPCRPGLLWEQGAAGSNPATPTILTEQPKPPEIIWAYPIAIWMSECNDFFDTYLMAKRHSAALGTAVSAELRNSANALEVAHPLEPELKRLWVSAEPAGPVPTDNSRLRRWVSQQLKLWRVLSLVKRQLTAQGPGILAPDFETATRALSPSQRPYASLFNDGAWRTILTAPYRLRAVDDRDARIRLGVEVSRIAFRTRARRCRASGTRLLVVFPPTKEDVFWPRVRNPEDHIRLRELVENEQRLKGELISSLAAEGVDYLDLLEPMRGAPSQPYFENADGHPNAVGHRAMAAAVAANVKAWLQAHR